MLRNIHTAVLLLTAFQGISPTPSREPARQDIAQATMITGNTVTNSALGVSYKFPKNMQTMDRAEVFRVTRIGHEGIRGTLADEGSEHAEMEERASMVVGARGQPKSPGLSPPEIYLVALDLSGQVPPSSEDAVFDLVRGFSMSWLRYSGFQELRVTGMPRKIYYGGQTFGQTDLELRIRIEGKEYHRYITFAGTPRNDHLVMWMFVASSASERNRLVNSALTIRFLKEKKP